MRHVLWVLAAAGGALSLAAGGSSPGAVRAPADVMFDGAVGSLLADSTEGADQETGDVAFDPAFRRTVRASSTDGNSKDAVDVTQDTFLDAFDGILAGVTTSSFLDASADDGTTGPSMAPRGISALAVTFTTDEPVTMLLEGVLGAAVSGAPGSCSRVTLEVIPSPSFQAAANVANPSCAGAAELVLDDEEVALDAGTYELVLDARTAPDAVTSDGSPHADGSASWNLEILLCPNAFTDGDDVLCGGGGDDLIDGADGFDRIFGGDGADGILGGPDPDQIEGGDGRRRAERRPRPRLHLRTGRQRRHRRRAGERARHPRRRAGCRQDQRRGRQ